MATVKSIFVPETQYIMLKPFVASLLLFSANLGSFCDINYALKHLIYFAIIEL
jgi:hypothetical protein